MYPILNNVSSKNSSGFSAGEEFVVAVREGQKLGSAIVLGDRDVEVTLRRLTEALAQTDLKELMNPDSELEKSMSELLPGKPPSPDMMDDAEFRQEMSSYVETMKAKDNVRKIMKELKKAAPAIYTALVEERGIYHAYECMGPRFIYSYYACFSLTSHTSFILTRRQLHGTWIRLDQSILDDCCRHGYCTYGGSREHITGFGVARSTQKMLSYIMIAMHRLAIIIIIQRDISSVLLDSSISGSV